LRRVLGSGLVIEGTPSVLALSTKDGCLRINQLFGGCAGAVAR